MKNKIFALLFISMLQLAFGRYGANAQAADGVYSVTVNTRGTFGQVMLQTVDNWSDVVELTVSGHLDESDMAYFSRLQNMTKLDLSGVDITSISGCQGLQLLQTVILPESVVEISENAFYGCYALSSINLDRIEEIGDYAFYHSAGLISLELPTVTEIGAYAFNYCSQLQSINIPNCIELGLNCFSNCSILSSVVLSDGLEIIPACAFYSTAIESINWPAGLRYIGRSSFDRTRFTDIKLPEGVKSIESNAFYGCPFVEISLPSSLERIGDGAFYQMSYDGTTYTLKDVYCKCVVPLATETFNTDMVKGATLHVPAFSVSAYKLDDNWYKFNKIVGLDGDLTDITINNTFSIFDYSGIADNANLSLTSSPSQNTAGHLSVGGAGTLSLNNFAQYQHSAQEMTGYYDENGNWVDIYFSPYCTTLIANNEVRANNVTTRIQLPTNQWSFISFPYDVNISSITAPDNVMWVVRKYNGSNRAAMSGDTWENMTSGQTLNAGEGYIFHCINGNSDSWSTEYVEFEFPAINNSSKNNIFTFNDVSRSINKYPSEYSHNRGWNLIGNPYPAYLSSRYIEFPAPVTIWNGYGYTAYSLADDEYVLRPNEAFFVQCPANTDVIKFLKDGRTHSCFPSSSPYYSRTNGSQSDGRVILNFILTGDGYSDRARLVLNESASFDYEIERDASKFMSSNTAVPQLYIADNGINYAIDERPIGMGECSLGIRTGKNDTYRITLDMTDDGYDVFLTDKETDVTVNLTETAYSFEGGAQTADNRFTVKIADSETRSYIEDKLSDNASYSINGNLLSVDGDAPVSIYTVDGRTVHQGKINGPIALPSGFYMLNIGNRAHKIIIK